MRRVAALGVLALLIVAWLALRSGDPRWTVEVTMDAVALDFDNPCPLMPDLVTDGYFTQGGSFGGLLETRTEEDANAVAECYRSHGMRVDVRRQTSSDAERIDEVNG